jgi:hypothetical protein
MLGVADGETHGGNLPQGRGAGNRGRLSVHRNDRMMSVVHQNLREPVAFSAFLFRARFAVLGVLAVLAVAAAVVALRNQTVPVGAVFLSALSLAAAFGVAFAHLRHGTLAALSVVAPLPGMLAAGPFAVAHGIGTSALLAVYGLATVAGAELCNRIARAAAGDHEPAAWWAAAPLVAPIGGAVLVAGAVVVGWLYRTALPQSSAVALELAAAGISAVVFTVLAAPSLWFGEAAVTQINRASEWRLLRLRLVTEVVTPRWALSVSGIVLVFAVLGGFGAAPQLARSALLGQPALWAASALRVFMIAFAVGRDWREALAATLALAALSLASLWLWGRVVGHLTVTSFVDITIVEAAALLLMLLLLEQARRFRLDGDAPAVARLRALEACAPAALYGCVGAAAAIVPWIVVHGSMATLAVLFALALGAAMLGAPAIATALDSLVRRRVSLESLYGRG